MHLAQAHRFPARTEQAFGEATACNITLRLPIHEARVMAPSKSLKVSE
jgi:hypothetical protein